MTWKPESTRMLCDYHNVRSTIPQEIKTEPSPIQPPPPQPPPLCRRQQRSPVPPPSPPLPPIAPLHRQSKRERRQPHTGIPWVEYWCCQCTSYITTSALRVVSAASTNYVVMPANNVKTSSTIWKAKMHIGYTKWYRDDLFVEGIIRRVSVTYAR